MQESGGVLKKAAIRFVSAVVALVVSISGIALPSHAAKRAKPAVVIHQALTAEFLVYTPDMWINEPHFLLGELRLTNFGCISFHSNEGEDMAAIFAPGTTWKNKALTIESFDNQTETLDRSPVRLGLSEGRQIMFFGSAEWLQNMAFKVTSRCLPPDAKRVAIFWGHLESWLTPEQRVDLRK